MPTFHASQVAAIEQDDVLVVSFGGEPVEGAIEYLTFQQSLDGYTDDDIALGMDQPYVEYRDQGWGWYGHMTKVELARDRLVVAMDASAAARLDGDAVFAVTFEIDDAAFDRLRAGLEKTFDACPYFAVRQ